jgi:hypothetical protein
MSLLLEVSESQDVTSPSSLLALHTARATIFVGGPDVLSFERRHVVGAVLLRTVIRQSRCVVVTAYSSRSDREKLRMMTPQTHSPTALRRTLPSLRGARPPRQRQRPPRHACSCPCNPPGRPGLVRAALPRWTAGHTSTSEHITPASTTSTRSNGKPVLVGILTVNTTAPFPI